jgi:metalloendopeptidase OMA1, mitochondrial
MQSFQWFASAVICAAVCVSCETTPYTNRSQLHLISNDTEAQMGAQAYQEVKTQSTLVQTGPQYDQIVRVGKRIAQAASADAPDFKWEFNLIKDDKQANAFCLPGGKIAVYTGILPVSQTDEGLAVVLGHEVAHAVLHHGAERVSEDTVTKLGLGVVDQFLGGTTSGTEHQLVMAALGAGAQVGVSLPHSRKQESEADHVGLILMTKAGYQPEEALSFWQRMEKMAGSGQPPQFLSDHPSHETRIQDIQKWIPEVKSQYGGGSNAPIGASRISSDVKRGQRGDGH